MNSGLTLPEYLSVFEVMPLNWENLFTGPSQPHKEGKGAWRGLWKVPSSFKRASQAAWCCQSSGFFKRSWKAELFWWVVNFF